MKVLVVCATSGEAVIEGLDVMPVAGSVTTIPHKKHDIDLIVTGIGMVATSYYLGRQLLLNHYDLSVNIGICGSFSIDLVGKVIIVDRDCFADMGAEDDDVFKDVFEIGLMQDNEFPFTNGWIFADNQIQNKAIVNLPEVKGVTVNRSSGNENNIYKLKARYDADVETMEGAAFFYCCRMNKIPCIQIRSVSNVIEKRNRAAWKIPEALSALKVVINDFFNDL